MVLGRRDLRGSTESSRPRGGGGRGLRLPTEKPARPLTFITISRQPGAGGVTFGEALVAHLNKQRHTGPDWQLWDQQLVETVSREHDLPRAWVEMLEDRDFSWLSELFAGLDFDDEAETNEFTIYRRVSETVRRLARRGRVVIVGRGGAYITADLPQGVHVRLVAPFESRVRHMARLLNVDQDAAEQEVRRRERNRQAFYERYWPDREQGPEDFTLTLNTENLDDATMVRALMPVLDARDKLAAKTVA